MMRTSRRSWSAPPSRSTRRRPTGVLLAGSGCSIALPALGRRGPAARRPAHRPVGPPARRRAAARRRSCSALVLFVALLGRGADDRAGRPAPLHLDPGRQRSRSTSGLLLDPLSMCFVLLITGRRLADPHLLHRLHGARPATGAGSSATSTCSSPRCCCWCWPTTTCVLFVGWEGVGLASYLLIGFWQLQARPRPPRPRRPSSSTGSATSACRSAIMLMFATFGTRRLRRRLRRRAGRRREATLTAIGLLLLLGACGKSAQFPLQSWLLDAMEGPTPVSALIHAATMVTAGVYLIVRSQRRSSTSRRTRRLVGRRRRRGHAAVRARSSAAPRTTSRRRWPARR